MVVIATMGNGRGNGLPLPFRRRCNPVIAGIAAITAMALPFDAAAPAKANDKSQPCSRAAAAPP
jgi:hypothetical protein